MTAKIVGLYRDQENCELARYRAGARDPVQLYRKTVWYKLHPRNFEYMRGLFHERYPNGTLVCLDESKDWLSSIKDADVIVLLYADPIGLGFSDVERLLDGNKLRWAAVRILNGRRRDFVLNRGTLWALRMRRLIARMMLGEMVFFIIFLFVTPWLLVRDLLGGRNG